MKAHKCPNGKLLCLKLINNRNNRDCSWWRMTKFVCNWAYMSLHFHMQKGLKCSIKGAIKAQGICLYLQSNGPGFESQLHHLWCCSQILSLYWEKDKNKQTRGRVWTIFLKPAKIRCTRQTCQLETQNRQRRTMLRKLIN